MIIAGILFYITSITMHKFIMKHPQIKHICDFGYHAFGKGRIAYEFTSFLLLANILLIGFHMLTGAKILNTLSDHSLCTVVFSVIATLMGIVMSLPRTLNHVSFMSMFSAACMALAILLFLIFAGIEDAPLYGYTWKLMAIAFFTTPPGEGVSFRASWLFRSAVDTVKECKIIFGFRFASENEEIHQNLKTDQN